MPNLQRHLSFCQILGNIFEYLPFRFLDSGGSTHVVIAKIMNSKNLPPKQYFFLITLVRERQKFLDLKTNQNLILYFPGFFNRLYVAICIHRPFQIPAKDSASVSTSEFKHEIRAPTNCTAPTRITASHYSGSAAIN